MSVDKKKKKKTKVDVSESANFYTAPVASFRHTGHNRCIQSAIRLIYRYSLAELLIRIDYTRHQIREMARVEETCHLRSACRVTSSRSPIFKYAFTV